MLTGSSPSAGPTVAASAQVFSSKILIVGPNAQFGLGAVPDLSLGRDTLIPVLGVPKIRVQVFHYALFNDGIANWVARSFLSWRVVGYVPGGQVTAVANVISQAKVPMSTPQTAIVNQPVSIQIRSGGLYSVGIEFDGTSGAPAANQGFDRVLVSISAAG